MKLKITFPPLHSGQAAVQAHGARFKVLACGRRWGKTYLGGALCLEMGLSGKRAWWIAPSYKMAAVGWRGIKTLAKQIPGITVHEVDRLISLPLGGEIQVRSADDPNSLRGEGLDFVVLDECAYMKRETWTEAVRPALSDRQGSAMFISTPAGHNFFWELYQAGIANATGEWRSWQYPTSSNPFIPASEIEAAKRDLPERIYLQEYEAQFLEDAGGVFRRVTDAATAGETEPEKGHDYAIGCDWGKSGDFTVLTVLDIGQRRMVAMDRFNKIDYAVQRGRLAALAERYDPTVIMAESNSMGEPIIEQLQRDGLPVRGFVTTNATKAQIIEALALAFERGDLRVLTDPTLIGELQAYEMTRLPSGMIRYSAPEGMHDDCVMSLALAWHAVEQTVSAIGSLGIW